MFAAPTAEEYAHAQLGHGSDSSKQPTAFRARRVGGQAGARIHPIPDRPFAGGLLGRLPKTAGVIAGPIARVGVVARADGNAGQVKG